MVKGSIGHAFAVRILTLEIRIKEAFALLLYMRFLFLLSPPLDTCVIF
jgi:hypothetical protein